MARGLRELVGRVMTDPEFLAQLRRQPDAVLADYQLTDQEQAQVRRALERLRTSPADLDRHELRSALIRRVST